MKKIDVKKTLYSSTIALIFLIAFFLRLKAAIIRPVIFDEAFTITYLIKFHSITDMILADASVPPLHYLLVKLMSNVSTNILWLRMPSIVFSILGLWITYKFAKKFSKKVALLALFMMSFSNFHILFSWQAYVYSQLFFLGAATIYLFFHLLTDKNIKHKNLKSLLLFISAVAGFLTHYGFIWTIVGLSLILFHKIILAKFDYKKIKNQYQKLILVGSGIFLFLVSYSPIIIYNFDQALKNIGWFDQINIYTVGESFYKLIGFYDQFSWNIFLASDYSKILFTIILLSIVFCLVKLKKEKINFLIVVSLINLLLPILFSVIIGDTIHATRAIIASSSTFTILFAIFIDKIFKKNLFYLFLIPFLIFYLNFSFITNRNQQNVAQEFDLIKQYVSWFRKHPSYLNKKQGILVYNKNHPISLPSSWVNYFVLNYYWKGYDGKAPLPNYEKIRTLNDIKQKHFYLLTVSKFDENESEKEIEATCPNHKTLQISSFDKISQQPSDLYYYDSLDIFVYECNPKE